MPAGRGYLDFISGIGVSSLGHAHPRLVAAIAAQAEQLLHTSNLYFHPLQAEAATRLAALSGLPRVFFCNSGTEAVEACLKFARRYWFTQGTPRSQVIAFERAFHGRTMGALSTTWDEHYRTPFAPLLEGVTFVSNSDPSELAAAVSEKTAAIIVEPLQGEGGVRPLRPEMAAAIKAACEKSGALLIADEVQCGLGRTGVPFYSVDPRPAAGPDGGRQGAGRRGSGGRGADLRAGRGDDRLRRSRHAPTAATCWPAGLRWCSSTS